MSDPSTAVAVPTAFGVGLEDFDVTDLVMPTLRIDHKEGVFLDGLTSERFGDEMDLTILGLVKQRILWPPEVGEQKAQPLCKSLNHTAGMPSDSFPWVESGFNEPTAENVTLPCADCKLKDWGSHPNRDAPWCTEQHTFAVLQTVVGDDDEEIQVPSILSLQRSALKPSRTYLSGFAKTKTPPFTVITKIKLEHRRRGNVDYAVPTFIKGEATPSDEWGVYADQYRQIRTFLQTPRNFEESGDADDDDDEGTPTNVAAPTSPDGVAEAVTEAAGKAKPDDDLPF